MAIFNNGFPATYPQMYPQYQPSFQQQGIPQMPQNQQPQSSGIIWVSGEAGARGFLVQPNTTVQLWDSDQQVIYLKSADASGMPSLKILDYTIRDQAPKNVSVGVTNPVSINPSDYVLKADFDNLKARFDEFFSKRASKTQKKEDIVDE